MTHTEEQAMMFAADRITAELVRARYERDEARLEVQRLREALTLPVVALGQLFKRFWNQDGGVSAGEWSDWLIELGLCDWQVEGNRPVLSHLGESALALATP